MAGTVNHTRKVYGDLFEKRQGDKYRETQTRFWRDGKRIKMDLQSNSILVCDGTAQIEYLALLDRWWCSFGCQERVSKIDD